MARVKYARRRGQQSPPPDPRRRRQRNTQRTDQPARDVGPGVSTYFGQPSHSLVTSGLGAGQYQVGTGSRLPTGHPAVAPITTLVPSQNSAQTFTNPAGLVQTSSNVARPMEGPRPTLPRITDLIPELAYLDLRAGPRMPFSHSQSTPTQQFVTRNLADSSRAQVPTSGLAEPIHAYWSPAGLAQNTGGTIPPIAGLNITAAPGAPFMSIQSMAGGHMSMSRLNPGHSVSVFENMSRSVPQGVGFASTAAAFGPAFPNNQNMSTQMVGRPQPGNNFASVSRPHLHTADQVSAAARTMPSSGRQRRSRQAMTGSSRQNREATRAADNSRSHQPQHVHPNTTAAARAPLSLNSQGFPGQPVTGLSAGNGAVSSSGNARRLLLPQFADLGPQRVRAGTTAISSSPNFQSMPGQLVSTSGPSNRSATGAKRPLDMRQAEQELLAASVQQYEARRAANRAERPNKRMRTNNAQPARDQPREFSILQAMINHPELALKLAKFLDVDSLFALYTTSRTFHRAINLEYPRIILAQAMRHAPDSPFIFPYMCYKSLCIKHPAGNGQGPLVPSFGWLRMVCEREQIARNIVSRIRQGGLYLPDRCITTVKKIWFLMDIPDNMHRIGIIQNIQIWTRDDLFLAVLFFMRLEMFFTPPESHGGQPYLQRMLIGQPSFNLLNDALERRALRTPLEVMQACVRWAPRTYPDRPPQPAFGVPANEVGQLQYEYYGRTGSRVRLMPPDELVLMECHRRGQDIQYEFFDYVWRNNLW